MVQKKTAGGEGSWCGLMGCFQDIMAVVSVSVLFLFCFCFHLLPFIIDCFVWSLFPPLVVSSPFPSFLSP